MQVVLEGAGMKRVTLTELQRFATQWSAARGELVQQWTYWEREAQRFFDITTADSELMHGVMLVVEGMFNGTIPRVKKVLREATPSVLEMCSRLLGHLPQCAPVIDAERRFRDGVLVCDWSMMKDGDKVIVRSEFRSRKEETEH